MTFCFTCTRGIDRLLHLESGLRGMLKSFREKWLTRDSYLNPILYFYYFIKKLLSTEQTKTHIARRLTGAHVEVQASDLWVTSPSRQKTWALFTVRGSNESASQETEMKRQIKIPDKQQIQSLYSVLLLGFKKNPRSVQGSKSSLRFIVHHFSLLLQKYFWINTQKTHNQWGEVSKYY